MLALAATSPLQGQENPPKPPYIKALPDFAEWTIVVGEQGAKSPPNLSQDPAQNSDPTRKEIIVTKMAKDRKEVEVWSDGSKTETWAVGDMLLYEFPGVADIKLTNRLDFSDFAEFQWLSAKNFQGVEKFEGKSCYVYRAKPPGAAQSGDQSEWVGWVDVQTGLPVALRQGVEFQRYRFRETSPSREAMPERFAKVLKNYEDEKQKLIKRHTMKL